MKHIEPFHDSEGDLTVRDVFQVLSRRRPTLLITLAVVFGLAVIISIITTRRYQATSIINLQKSSSDGLDLDSLMGNAADGATDALTVNIDLQTQVNILESDQLALQVIQDEKLEQNVDFRPHFDLISVLLRLISTSGPADPPGRSLAESPGRREHDLKVFQKNLSVELVSGTRLITVAYSNPDPRVAAAVANDLVKALTEYTFQTKFTATNDASRWLEAQLADLRKQSTDLQSKVVEVQRSTGLFGVGGTDPQGKPIIYSPVLQQLQEMSAELATAQSNRLLKGSIAQVAKTGNPDLISELSGTTMASAASTGVASSLDLIASLRTQEATLQQEIGRDSTIYGAAYPKLIEEKASLTRVQESLASEVARIGTRAQNDYAIADRAADGIQTQYNQNKRAAEKLNDKTIEYVLLAKEADESQQLYNDLLKRLREAGILDGLRSSNITIVSAALVPSKPHKPNVPIYLLAGIVGGLLSGVGLALLVDAIDNKIQGPEQIEAEDLPLLGVLPPFPTGTLPLVFATDPTSSYSESTRSFRGTLLISRQGSPPKAIMVTSGASGEGKSTISLSLALALSHLDKRVLLVEADMRRPVLGRRLGLNNLTGLSTYLSDATVPTSAQYVSEQSNLGVVTAGPTPPAPAELLSSNRMRELLAQWKDEYDFIIFDAPPILPVADAQALVELMDSVVVVVRAKMSSRTSLSRIRRIILQHQPEGRAVSFGVVINALSVRSAGYYGYYGYYGKSSYYNDAKS
jgi:polysaccharide biosynthesis transport protein